MKNLTLTLILILLVIFSFSIAQAEEEAEAQITEVSAPIEAPVPAPQPVNPDQSNQAPVPVPAENSSFFKTMEHLINRDSKMYRAQPPQAAFDTSAPARINPAADPAYPIGIEDILDINVLQPEQIATTVSVAPDGSITYPYIGRVVVKGYSLAEVQEEIQRRLGEGFMQYPVVMVSLRESRSRKFSVYGQVARPGSYLVDGDNMTVIQAISAAGGFTVPGSSGVVKILRTKEDGTSEKIEVTMDSTMSSIKDVKIKPGDSLMVFEDKFFIYGEIMRPGPYPLEDNITLLRALAMAGGFTQPGSCGRVKILRPRSDGDDFETIEAEVNADMSLPEKNKHLVIKSGDTIMVYEDKFFIYGEVLRPGPYALEDNTTLLRAISLSGGFNSPGSSGRAKILRSKEGGGFQMLEARISSEPTLDDKDSKLLIKAGDTVTVYGDKFYVYGEVLRPGAFALEHNTTVMKAISMAGGFTKFGSASRVKILRLRTDGPGYDSMKVNIKEVMEGYGAEDLLLEQGDIIVISEGVF